MKLPNKRLCIFLSFNGNAQKAMEFYQLILPDVRTESLTLFGKDDPNGEEGKVLNGTLSIADQSIMFMDMQPAYPAPPFSWAASLLINCATESEFELIFNALSQNGNVMMDPEPVFHMRKCTWVTDQFGVTWQLIWE